MTQKSVLWIARMVGAAVILLLLLTMWRMHGRLKQLEAARPASAPASR